MQLRRPATSAKAQRIAEKSFSGPVFPEIREYFTDSDQYIDRSTMNTWEDTRVVAKVASYKKPKLRFEIERGFFNSVTSALAHKLCIALLLTF